MAQQLDKALIEQLKLDVELGMYDTAYYAKAFLPNRFPLDWSPIHDKIWEAIDARIEVRPGVLIPKHRKICIVSSRGIGKTSIAKTIVDKSIRYKSHNFILYVGKSETFATLQTENIKRSVLQNKMANLVFPGQDKPTSGFDADKLPTDFSKHAWMINDVLVMPRGWGQPIRGLSVDFNMYTYRPSLEIFDDLEDPKDINSQVFRDKLRVWFYGDVDKSKPMESMNPNWQYVYIDTLKSQDSLIEDLKKDPSWYVLELPIADDDGKWVSNAPDFISTDLIREEYENHKALGLLNVFYQEYMCKHTATELREFKAENFRYYRETDESFLKALNNGTFVNVVLGDPAKKAQLQSADSALTVWGFDLVNHKAYLRWYDRGKWKPSQFRNNMFYYAKLYSCVYMGLEVTGLDEYASEPYITQMQNEGSAFMFEELSAHTGQARDPEFGINSGKVTRIAPMAELYPNTIFHNADKHTEYETQLLDFPSPKLWDLIDCGSYMRRYVKRFGLLMTKLQEQDSLVKQFAQKRNLQAQPLPPNAGAII